MVVRWQVSGVLFSGEMAGVRSVVLYGSEQVSGVLFSMVVCQECCSLW